MLRLLERSSVLASRFFVLFVIFGAGLGWAKPSAFSWIEPWIAYFLGLLMFGAGATLSVKELQEVIRRPVQVGAGVALQYALMPLFAFVLVQIANLSPELALGVILVGSCPGGIASNVITFMARGDVALSVAVTSVSTFLAPILTPLAIFIYTGMDVDVPVISLFLSILQIIVAPLSIGVVARLIVGARLASMMQLILPVFSVTVLTVLAGFVIGSSRDVLMTASATILVVVFAHNLMGCAAGAGAARLLGYGPAQQKAYCFEIGMQNSSLAIALASLYFSPVAAVAAAVFSIWHNISGPAIASIWSARQ